MENHNIWVFQHWLSSRFSWLLQKRQVSGGIRLAVIRVAQQSLAVAAGGAWIAVGLVQKSQGQFSVMEPGTGLDDPAVGAKHWTLASTVFYGFSSGRAWNEPLRG